MPQIIYDQFHLGQNQDNPLVATNNTLTHMIGCSPHEQLGLVGSGPSALQITFPGGTPPPTAIVPYSESKVYMFFPSGTLYRYDIGFNTFTLIGTTGTVTDAIYFDGYIYFSRSTLDKIGRMDVATETINLNPFPLVSSNFLISTTPFERYHPMFIMGDDLYIGNEYLIAAIDRNHVFIRDALDIPKDYRVTALTNIGGDLVIGTENKLGFPSTKIFRWNRWSEDYSTEALIDKQTVAYFIQDNGDLYFVATTPNASIFAYNEPYPVEMTMIPGSSNNPVQRSNMPLFTPNHIARWRGRTFFPFNGSNTSYFVGIYSYHGMKKGLPQQISTELLAPNNNAATIITTVASIGRYLFFGYNSGGANQGVAMATLTNGGGVHATSTIYTPYIHIERQSKKDFTVTIPYRGINTGETLSIEAESNYDGNWNLYTGRLDADRGIFYTDIQIGSAQTMRLRITLNNGAVNPILLEKIIIDFP